MVPSRTIVRHGATDAVVVEGYTSPHDHDSARRDRAMLWLGRWSQQCAALSISASRSQRL
jgi:hypothetical protein